MCFLCELFLLINYNTFQMINPYILPNKLLYFSTKKHGSPQTYGLPHLKFLVFSAEFIPLSLLNNKRITVRAEQKLVSKHTHTTQVIFFISFTCSPTQYVPQSHPTSNNASYQNNCPPYHTASSFVCRK